MEKTQEKVEVKTIDLILPTQEEVEEKVIQVDRVTRVVKGGRRMRFRATVVVGNKNGKVGVGVAKGNEVANAVSKASAKARKNMIDVKLKGTTIAHEVSARQTGACVFLKPASKGTGVIAGGAVRSVLEAVGVQDILSKMIGSNSKINNALATIEALKSLKESKVKIVDKTEKTVKAEAAKEETPAQENKKKGSK